MNDYDIKITDGLKAKLNSELSIGNEEYLGIAKFIPLIEKYPGVYLKENNLENIFENSKEIVIGIQLPEDLGFNDNYKIYGNLLELNYGDKRKEMLKKVVILDGRNRIKRVIALENIENNKKMYLDDSEERFLILEKVGTMIGEYVNLKIKIEDEEIIINEEGDSEIIVTPICDVQVDQGKILLSLNKEKIIEQGSELNFKVLSLKDEVLEKITLQIYLKLY